MITATVVGRHRVKTEQGDVLVGRTMYRVRFVEISPKPIKSGAVIKVGQPGEKHPTICAHFLQHVDVHTSATRTD